MIRNTAREIAVHLAYELSFTDKTVKELLDERLTKEYFDTLKDEDNIYEKAPGAAQTEYIRSIVSGVAEGCVQSGAALIGGETAEMPGFYPVDEYDLAGFSVGVVDKSKILDPSTMKAGDVVIALPSSGVHSNGFSLVRKVLDVENSDIKSPREELGGKSVGETLLTPTKIYVRPVLALLEQVKVKGISHITGGGFFENVPRMLPDGICAELHADALPVPPVFTYIAKVGQIDNREMYNTFNMGVGMALIVAQEDADCALAAIRSFGMPAEVLGVCRSGEKGVSIR